MNIKICMKSIGSRKPKIELVDFQVADDIKDERELIEDIVRRNVKSYNAKEVDSPIFKWLTHDEIEDSAIAGKVGFNDRKSDKMQDEDEAVKVALQAYDDGLFKVLVDDDVVTFVRLSLLAGRLW